MFESKRMIRASTPHIEARCRPNYWFIWSGRGEILRHVATLVLSIRWIAASLDIFITMRKRWEVTRSSSEAIYEHKLHRYMLKSNDDIAESFCCEHIEFEQPMTSTTSSWIANRNETSFQMLREWCYNISNCLHTSYQQYGTCKWSIDSMEPLFKKLWKQSKFRLQLFFSKN